MKTTLYLNGKKTTVAEVVKHIGKDRFDTMKKEAVETFREDPYIDNSFFIGKGILTFRFS